MAVNVKITNLPSAVTPTGTEVLALVQSGVTSKNAVNTLLSAPGGAGWVGNTPAGTVAATTVQGAINELDSEKVAFTRLDDSDGSSLVGFLQAGTGAVVRTAQSKMRETVSVKDFGAVGDGVADDTAAIQAGINACVVAGQVLYMPAGSYLVTYTINIPSFTHIVGEHKNMNARGFSVDPKGTKISFQPTSAKSLFVASGTPPFGSFRSSYSIEGLYIAGNSASVSGNSVYAIDVDSITSSTFRDLAIQYFRTGIRCDATINNRFEYVRVINCYIQCVLYDGGIATTDVWEQCYISNAPIGVQTNGVSLGIRFNSCIFETLDNYGVNLVREVYGWQFSNPYVEDVPGTNNANGAMWRVGYDGTTLAGFPQLLVTGGLIGGRNAGAVGSMLDVDYTDGVTLSGFLASRYTNVVRTTSNTQSEQIVLNVGEVATITTVVSDATKISGQYPHGNYSASTRNVQNGRWRNITVLNNATIGNLLGDNVTPTNWFAPTSDNNKSLGYASGRWSEVYAGAPAINTSDEREKQDIADLDAAEKRVAVALKGLVKKFRFKDAVQAKGDAARIHVGVIAQEVIAAFQAEGLDPMRYSLVCYDEWDAVPEVLDDDGNVVDPARPAGNRYGIRYEELLAFIIAAL